MTTAAHKKRKALARPAKTLIATNQNWTHSGACLVGYDARGEERVVAALGLQQTRVVTSCVLPNNGGVLGLTEDGTMLRFQFKTPSLKQQSFDLVLDSQNPFGSRNARYSSDSALLSKEGRFVFISNWGGIRAVSVEGETVDRVENEVEPMRRRDA